MQIRPAQPQDIDQICDIWNPIIRDSLITFTTLEKTPTDIATLISAAPFLVATDGDTVLGFTTYGPFRGGPGYVQTKELSINLAPAAQGKGIGAHLLRALEKQAKTNGITALIAGVSGANPKAICFHERMGYANIATLPKVGQKFDQRLDLVLLQKLL